MTDVVARREVFRSISSGLLRESEFEGILRTDADLLFPGFFFVPFKARVEGPTGGRKADFALIDHQYRRWWVVEVELSHHSFRGHVLPQVEALSAAVYGEAEAVHLARQDGALDLGRLRDMMLGESPRVLVIVDQPRSEWRSELRVAGALMLVVSVHRSPNGRAALVVDGEYPTVSREVLSVCRRNAILPRAFILESPGAIPVGEDGHVEILYRDRVTSWRRVDQADQSWLMPLTAADEIGVGSSRVEILKINGETLVFRETKTRRV